MEKTLNYLFAALMLLASVSCTKNVQPERPADKVITCSFAANDAGAKTTLNGLTPIWSEGDRIKLTGYKRTGEYDCEEKGSVTVTLSAGDILPGGNKCTLAVPGEWNLGPDDYVYAVYPAENAAGIIDGGFPYVDKTYFTVPSIQDGTFAGANICVGRLSMYESCLRFQNVTSVLKISVPAGAFKKLEVFTGESYIAMNGEAWVSNLYGTLNIGWGSTKSATTTVNISPSATEIYFSVAYINFLGIGSTFTFTRADDTTKIITLTHNNNSMWPGTLYDLGTVLPD